MQIKARTITLKNPFRIRAPKDTFSIMVLFHIVSIKLINKSLITNIIEFHSIKSYNTRVFGVIYIKEKYFYILR